MSAYARQGSSGRRPEVVGLFFKTSHITMYTWSPFGGMLTVLLAQFCYREIE
jgi:hypothetical protein